jgi:hypothetical protein
MSKHVSLPPSPPRPRPVFDEHHFGRFTNQYLAGTYFFDIHPPLGQSREGGGGGCSWQPTAAARAGKLVLWGVARLVGYDGPSCRYDNIDDPYGPNCGYYWLRAVGAAHGAATAPLLYAAVRLMGWSPIAAVRPAPPSGEMWEGGGGGLEWGGGSERRLSVSVRCSTPAAGCWGVR